MLDRILEYAACLAEPHRWAVATVAEVSGSVPRPAGTSMAVRDDALTIGSVSGGCVEAAVVAAALDCIASGTSSIEDFGYSENDALAIGLTCGGGLRVMVQPFTDVVGAATDLLADPDRATGGRVLVRMLPDPDRQAGPGVHAAAAVLPAVIDTDAPLPAPLAQALGPAAAGLTERVRAGGVSVLDVADRDRPDCPVVARLLVESLRHPTRLVIYGANDYSAALSRNASLLDRHVVVCDARPVFATPARHPGAHQVVVRQPAIHLREELAAGRLDRRSAVVVLTHDPRFDLPVLDLALRSDIGYVGAMGSRSTHGRRAQELLHGGLPRPCLDRLHSPIGLDIGARTPQEVAVAILAEIVAVCSGRTSPHGVPELRQTEGPVHDARRVGSPTAAVR